MKGLPFPEGDITVQAGFRPLDALIYDLTICDEGNRLLLTGFQMGWGVPRALLL